VYLEPETKSVLLNKIVDYIWQKPVSTQAISVTALVTSVNSVCKMSLFLLS